MTYICDNVPDNVTIDQPREWEWRMEPPTEDGFYWATGPSIDGVEMTEVIHGVLYTIGWETDLDPAVYKYWLGPLPEPGPPTASLL